jgi:hypothetical protein
VGARAEGEADGEDVEVEGRKDEAVVVGAETEGAGGVGVGRDPGVDVIQSSLTH